MNFNVFPSKDENVFKYVFHDDKCVMEAVLYRYGDFYKRTVICCSVMSGCPVGCTFCGTGKNFIRNLTHTEIFAQISTILHHQGIEDINERGERFQIMFMSMGEPMLNFANVQHAIRILHKQYRNAELLLSTIGPRKDDDFGSLLDLSCEIDKVGLQFSIHRSNDNARDVLIPYKNKYSLQEIRDRGLVWWKKTSRNPYLNYCIDGTNNTQEDADALMALFSPAVFCLTFSVVCSSDETMKDAGYKNLDAIRNFENLFLQKGYNTRIFDPAGQDDIGGGCGQLWYVQKWIKEHTTT